MKYVILGSGICGRSAAGKIIELDNQAEVTMISGNESRFYYRPGMIQWACRKEESVPPVEQDFNLKNIEFVSGVAARSIDPENHTVVLEDSRQIAYDRLLLSIGARPVFPGFEGAEKENVFSSMELSDFERFRSGLERFSRILVLGAGLVGVEWASALAAAGKEVVLVEKDKRLMKNYLDWPSVEILTKALLKNGVRIFLEETVEKISGGSELAVTLSGGSNLEFDAVIVACGMKFDPDLLKGTKILFEKRILVNDHFETSARDVFCAGDSSQHRGIVYGNWKASLEQGQLAGRNMAGEVVTYRGTVNEYRLKIKGFELYCVGRMLHPASEILVANEGCIYRKLLIEEDDPAGAIIVNDPFTAQITEQVFNGSKSLMSLKKYF